MYMFLTSVVNVTCIGDSIHIRLKTHMNATMEIFTLVTFTLFLILLCVLLMRVWEWWREARIVYAAVKKLPGPKTHWLWGNLHEVYCSY